MKGIKKTLCLLLSLVMILSMGVPALAFDNATSESQANTTSSETSPFSIELSTDKSSYSTTGIAKITAKVTNTSGKDIQNVSTEAVFTDLAPVKNGQTTAEAETLKNGESLEFTYRATINKNAKKLNIIEKIILFFVRLFNGGYSAKDNGFDNGREFVESSNDMKFGKHTAVNGVKVWFGEFGETALSDEAKKELENIKRLNNGKLPKIEYNKYNSIDWLHGNYYDGTVSNEAEVINSLNSIKNLLRINNASEEFRCRWTDKDSTVYRLQQYYQGYKVIGEERIVSVDKSSETIDSINGSNVPVENIDTTINYSKEQVLEILEKEVEGIGTVINTVIYKGEGLNYEIAYEINSNKESAKLYYVSAKSAKILGSTSFINFERIEASGIDNNNNSRNFYSEKVNDNLYYLADYDKNITIFDAGNKNVELRVDGDGISADWHNTLFNIDSWFTKAGIVQSKKNDWSNKKAVTLMANLSNIYDYYLETIGIRGFNNNNGDIRGIINDNLKGDSTNACSYSHPALKTTVISMGIYNDIKYDTVAHEYTHSVLGAIVDLDDFGEAGTLNEAYADIMGVLAENDSTWTHTDGDRVLSNPDINNYPSYYKGKFWCDSSDDSEVVHTNCTVIGHAAYLMSKYGKISNDRLANIWYTSIKYLKPDSNFHDCKTAVIKAAHKLNCDENTINVINSAFYEVGIYDGKGTISGTVCEDNTNTALPNVTVRFNSGLLNYSTKTNSTGNFKIIELPAGTWEISVEDTDTHWCHEKQTITVEKGEEITITPPFYMKKGTKIQGCVRDSETKAPIANAKVELRDGTNFNAMHDENGKYHASDFEKYKVLSTTTTDENGKYTFNMPSGKYIVAVYHDDYEFNGLYFSFEKNLDGYFPADILLVPNDDGDDGDDGNDAFFNDYNIHSVIIPDSVISIGKNSFYGCTSLTDIIIPNSVTGIGDSSFEKCTNLNEIEVPMGVLSIGVRAFAECKNLENIIISDSVKNIGGFAFTDTKWYDNQQNGIVYAGRVCYHLKGDTFEDTYIIKEGTVSISDYAFNCSGIKNIILPNSLISIGEYAFNYCKLINVTIPENVKYIEKGAFNCCGAILEVTILNPSCIIQDDLYESAFDSGTRIRGYKNSTAQAYAEKNNCTFIPLD